MGKASIFKPQVDKMFFRQTTGGQNVIYPKKKQNTINKMKNSLLISFLPPKTKPKTQIISLLISLKWYHLLPSKKKTQNSYLTISFKPWIRHSTSESGLTCIWLMSMEGRPSGLHSPSLQFSCFGIN